VTILMVFQFLRITHWIWHPKTSCQNQIKITNDSSILFTFLCHDTHLNSFYLSTSFHSDWNKNIFIHQMLSCATANWRESKHNFFLKKKVKRKGMRKSWMGKMERKPVRNILCHSRQNKFFCVCISWKK